MVTNVEHLTSDSFAPFGKILGDNDFPDASDNEDFSWRDMSGGLMLAEQNCTGLLNCRHRDMVVKQMEFHLKSPEVMVLLNGDSIFCVAASDVKAPDADNIKAFYVKQGTALMMDTGVWHCIPFSVERSGSKFLILFRDGTGADDLNFHELQPPLEVNKGGF